MSSSYSTGLGFLTNFAQFSRTSSSHYSQTCPTKTRNQDEKHHFIMNITTKIQINYQLICE